MGPKHPIADLPCWEIRVYWLLSIGSHLHSFYQLHRFSKEYEDGLGREFELQKGFLIWGFKKDPTDFEWSFWSDWAKKSLLWTLLGHAVISRLASILIPQRRVAVLTAYGVLAAWSTLGARGVGVVVLHTCLSFTVAQLRRPALSWTCALLLLASLHVGALEDLQRDWYETEAEYYLLLFSVAVCCLRSISYSLEHCWRPLEAGSFTRFCWLAAYTFYHPLFYNGPIVNFQDFTQQMQRPNGSAAKPDMLPFLASAARICTWWGVAETMIHLMYMHAVQSNETYLQILPPWALGGLALALVQFFYVKYLVLFGVPSLLVRLDGLEPPRLPRCVSIMYSFTGMWRHFDVGLYHWLIRYIYIPTGGSHHGPLWKMLSTALAFGFVCYWHGGHDYLQNWALMNWLGVTVENGLKAFLSSPLIFPCIERCLSAPMRRRAQAFLSAFSTAMLILSNLVFLGGNHVGRIFWKRVFIQGWSTSAVPTLVFLYCFAQVGLEWDRKQQ
ncbi:protein-cysteine N-palmitoyltransferase HHAT [Megalops cyprinoides]|uniref:protein-cysteine N-palmitoyltransferase HHAT n=1 Tax=Megalops cyprinoides TaxID=118141 RepID=UPI0018648D5A|nr:protein-cysteine N-palmitoyltransferase HHAT [Megalops cyprinoides]